MNNGHDLMKLMESSTRLGLRFCPLEYIKTLSRELHRALDGQRLLSASIHKLQDTHLTNISIINIPGYGSLTNSVHHIPGHTSYSKMKEKIDDFICLKSKDSDMVYTDGSVYGGEAGSGASSAILYPPTVSGTVSHHT